MAKKIAVIGLGRVGVSIGMALADRKGEFATAGLDRDGDVLHEVSKLKVFDTLTSRLPELLQGADALVLAIPFDELEITFQSIAPLIGANTLILDTSPVKRAVFAWTEKHLPAATQFLSFTPVINPAYLLSLQSGFRAAAADLFQGGLFLMCGAKNITRDSTRFAEDLAASLGGSTYLSDPAELDGLLAAYALLPKLTAAAYYRSIARQGGWNYGRKLTGSAFAEITRPLSEPEEREGFGLAALENRENTLRVLDNLLDELQSIRGFLQDNDAAGLQEDLGEAYSGYAEWWQVRQENRWEEANGMGLRNEKGFLTGVMGLPSLKKKK